jgi:hypothetical protein
MSRTTAEKRYSNMLTFNLIRKYFTENSTIGELFCNGNFICFVLEDKDRGLDSSMTVEEIKKIKVYGKTAIPTGEYSIQITYSPKYKRDVPQVMNVKGYSGIRIHSGNTAGDSEGCLLPGMKMVIDKVLESKIATAKWSTMIKIALDEKKEVRLKITTKNK